MNQADLRMLLSRVDLDHPGMARIGALLDRGDEAAAFEAVVHHFRTRTEPVYLFDESALAGFDDPETVSEAERICGHEILGHRFDGPIDWHVNATESTTRDSEWTWSLARHGFWVPLARAYAMTADEKYAREFTEQLKGWVAAWPVRPHMDRPAAEMSYPGDAWRSIEAGIRIYTVWLPVMVYFRRSPSWDAEGWLCFLNSLYDHGEFLSSHYSNHSRCSNWLTMESTALFQLGVMFPELKRAADWRSLAYRRISHEVRYQFDHTGVHIERTPIYHLVAVLAFLQAYRMARLNGLPTPPYALALLERGAEFLMALVKPDLTIPMIGDADRVSLTDRTADRSVFEGMNLTTDPQDLNEVRAFFRTMGEITGREDFRFLGSAGREGRPPRRRCWSLPEAGYYVFRSGWSREDSYFLLTATQVERGSNAAHSHSDAGHLELHIRGEDVLSDSGRYLYGNCGRLDWWRYFQSTAAHNTVDVDGHFMGAVPDTPPEVRGLRGFCHRFEATQRIDCVEISHNGFAFLPEPVFHLRRVVHFKPDLWLVDDVLTGLGCHHYNLYFNFAPGRLQAASTPGGAEGSDLSGGGSDTGAFVFTGKRVVVRCEALLTEGLQAEVRMGQTEPKGGWISYAYSVKEPAPQLVYTRTGPPPARFITVLRTGTRSTAALRALHEDGTVEITVSTGEGTASAGERYPASAYTVLLGLESFELPQVP